MEAGHYKVIIYLNQSHVSQTILTFPVTFTAHPLPPPWGKKKVLINSIPETFSESLLGARNSTFP